MTLLLPAYNKLIGGGGAGAQTGGWEASVAGGGGTTETISATLDYDGVLVWATVAQQSNLASIGPIFNGSDVGVVSSQVRVLTTPNYLVGVHATATVAGTYDFGMGRLFINPGDTDIFWYHYPFWDSDGTIGGASNAQTQSATETTLQRSTADFSSFSDVFLGAAAFRNGGTIGDITWATYTEYDSFDADGGTGPNYGFYGRISVTEIEAIGLALSGTEISVDNALGLVSLRANDWDAVEQI